ncbi:MAG: hypothetical protein ACQETB_02715 [Halobacteriota archaeon]
MTPPMRPLVDRPAELPSGALDDRLRRAILEAMAVRSLPDGRYVVETAGGTYVVDSETGTCTCPDAAIRSSVCKHRRRVSIERRLGRLAPSGGYCAVCGDPIGTDSTSGLCGTHRPAVGEFVRDRETGSVLVVRAVVPVRADEYRTPERIPVASYPSNANYGDHEPIVVATYTGSIGPDAAFEDAPRYGFPASRVVRFEGRRGRIRYPGVEVDSAAPSAGYSSV